MNEIMPPMVPGRPSLRAPAQFRRPLSAKALRKERNENIPKIKSAQEPNDIGDQYLNIGWKVLDSISMCQKRSGRCRSTVKRMPLIRTQGNEIK
jgi:hypothetical protein